MKALKNNTLAGLMEWFQYHLSEIYDADEARSVSKIIFGEFFGLQGVDFVLKKGERYSESQILLLYRVIKQLTENIPVQYITGKSYFRDLVLKVTHQVLIPRPETEELVQWIIDDSRSLLQTVDQPLKIWDIGTGSGAIALSLAREIKFANVFATDISEKALEVALYNADTNHIKPTFLLHDVLEESPIGEDFNLIVSNPPYIRNSEKRMMHANVLSHEPHLALFVSDDDPLLFYRCIAKTALLALKPGSGLYVEINEAFGKETADLFIRTGFASATVKKDLFGKDRFVRAIK